MKIINKISQIILKSKFRFSKPRQSKTVIYDVQSEKYLKPFFKEDEYFILFTRYEEINFYIILKLIFKFKKVNLVNYLSELIDAIKPKIVITFIDNDVGFYKLKKLQKNTIFIAVQNGTRFVTGDFLSFLSKNKDIFEIDHYFIFNDCYGQQIGKYIKSNFITIGSLKNNIHNIKNSIKPRSLCYISRMSNIFFDYAKVLDVKKIKSNYEKWEIELLHYTLTLLANISKYCEKNEIKLNILGASQNFDLEEKFFKNIFKKNTFNFLKKTSLYNSYKNIDQFSVAINAMSTFGYEAIARKKKVCFFSGDFIEGSNFLWPISNLKKGNFFTNSNNLNEVTRILDYLLNLQEKVWCQEIEEYNKKLFFYDEGNNKFKNFIKKLV